VTPLGGAYRPFLQVMSVCFRCTKTHRRSHPAFAAASAIASRGHFSTVRIALFLLSASLQSAKAIASALDSQLEKPRLLPEKRMKTYEYKSLVLNFRAGIFKQGLPDIQKALNKEGQQGWQFKQMLMPSSALGTSDSMVAILERAVD
jgi:hypothetical protein